MSIHERMTGARNVIIRGRYSVVTLARTDSGSWVDVSPDARPGDDSEMLGRDLEMALQTLEDCGCLIDIDYYNERLQEIPPAKGGF